MLQRPSGLGAWWKFCVAWTDDEGKKGRCRSTHGWLPIQFNSWGYRSAAVRSGLPHLSVNEGVTTSSFGCGDSHFDPVMPMEGRKAAPGLLDPPQRATDACSRKFARRS